MKKILITILSILTPAVAFANQPKDWQLGFQKAASESMRDIVNLTRNFLKIFAIF